MGRYTGPKARINRRLGFQVFENAGAIRAFERKEYPPGMVQRRRKLSDYGLALIEKQKIKFYYGLRERNLRIYFDKARKMAGNTGENLMILCERRLDNVVRRAGFCLTRPQARQGIVHGHFLVNGKRVDRPSFRVKVGDVVSVKNRPNLKKLYQELAGQGNKVECSWINFDDTDLRAVVTSLPNFEDVSLSVEVGKVVAFLSR
ncbi:MAG: 30S ribosomal protein S4 [Planctomycetaceae bacterium]|nr:30S ribosomal protein S4 [Planctomycetaceae bacterium]